MSYRKGVSRISAPLLLSAMVFAPLAVAHAQDADPKQEGKDTEASIWRGDTIVVVGSRYEQYGAGMASITRTLTPLTDVPQSIQVLTSALLEEQELTTLSDAMRNVSGVVAAQPSESVLANPIIRGFRASLYADGLLGFGDTSTLDPSSLVGVERIEVAKGPTATLYGGGVGAPVGGIINVVSKKAEGEARYAFGIRAGSRSTIAPHLDINQPLGDHVGVRIGAEYYSANDYIDEVDAERVTIAPAMRVDLGTQTTLSVAGSYNKTSQLEYSGLPAELIGDARVDVFQFVGARNAPKTEVENWMATPELSHRFSEDLSINVKLRRYESKIREFSAPGFFPLFGTQMFFIKGQLHTDVQETTLDGSLLWEKTIGGVKHAVLVGMTYDKTDYESGLAVDFNPIGILDFASGTNALDYGDPIPAIATTVQDYRTFSAYINDEIKIGERVNILLSGRYSEYSITEAMLGASDKRTYRKVDPRIGASIRVQEGLSVFAGWATGSRLVRFFSGEGGAPSVPETSQASEIGLKFDLKGAGLFGTVSAYRLVRKNVPTPSPTELFASVQSGKQRSKGLELDLVWEPLRSLSILGSFALTDAKVIEDNAIPIGDRLDRVPRTSGRLAARYRFKDGVFEGLGLGGGLTYASASETTLPNSFRSAGYTIFDAQASYEIGAVRLGFNVTNLFNKRYFVPYAFLAQPLVRPGQPRSAFVSLSTRL